MCNLLRAFQFEHPTVFMDSFRLPNTKVGKDQYSWAFICVDSLTRMCYIAPTHLQTALSLSTKQSAEQEVEGEYEPGKRPSSEQTFRHFKEFMRRIDMLRQEHAKRNGTAYHYKQKCKGYFGSQKPFRI